MADKKYKVDNKTYEIPDAEAQAFLKDFPTAVEVEDFVVDKDTFEIPITERDAFLKDFPQAKSVKKKVSVAEFAKKATEGVSLLEEYGLKLKKPSTQKPPLPYTPAPTDYKETLPSDLTLGSITQANEKRTAYLIDQAEQLQEEAIKNTKEDLKKLSENFGGDMLEGEKNRLIESRTKEVEKAIEDLLKETDYRFIAGDTKTLSDQLNKIINSGASHDDKEARIEALRQSVLGDIPEEGKPAVMGELNRLIADVAMDTPLGQQFILKNTAKATRDSLVIAKEKMNKEFEEKYGYPQQYTAAPGGMGGYNFTSKEQADAFYALNDKNLKLDVAISHLNRALNTPESKEGAGKMAFQNELKNIASAGVIGMVEKIVTASGARQQAEGVKNEANDALVNAYELLQNLDQIAREEVDRYRRVGQIAGSIPYIEQFLLTGPIGSKASTTAQSVSKAILESGIKNRIAQGLVKRTVQPITEGLISAVGRVPISPATYGNIAQEAIGNLKQEGGEFVVDEKSLPKISEAIAKGVYTSATDIFTEGLGGMVALPAKWGSKIITPEIRNFFKMAGIQNIGGEWFEEGIAQKLQGGKLDKQFLTDLAITIPVVTAGFSALVAPAIAKNIKLRVDNKAVLDKFGKDNVANIRDLVERGDETNLVNTIEQLSEGATPKDVNNLIRYAGSLVQDNVVREMTSPDKGTVTTQVGPLKMPETPQELTKTEESTLREHRANIEQKFRDSFSGVPQEQVEGALALMDARAKSWASETGKSADEWYQRIADVKEGEFTDQATPKLYQLPDGRQVMGINMPEVVNGFYSPIEKRLSEFKQEKASVNKWKEIIGKGDEATFTGVLDWLNGMKPDQSLSKAEINQFMKDNRIEVVEVELGKDAYQNLPEYKEAQSKAEELIMEEMRLKNKWYESKDEADFDAMEVVQKERDRWIEKMRTIERNKESSGVTKFSQYQLPGEKENYKEVLVTMPPKASKNFAVRSKQIMGEDVYEVYNIKTDKKVSGGFDTKESAQEYINGIPAEGDFTSSHFDEPNILVHLRMNTRVDAEGKKVLFLEEIQSDWGQKGKKEGFVNKEITELPKEYEINEPSRFHGWLVIEPKGVTGATQDVVIADEATKEEAVQSAIKKLNDKLKERNIPSAPFVTDTNAWVKLGLKTALKEAIKQGVDRIAWSTGTQQFERWGSEKVDWVKIGDKGWKVNIHEQVEGTAFEGMNVDEEAMWEKGVTITNKEDLRAKIKKNLSRERNEAELDKLTDRIWGRMQTEDEGTSLPRKEGMESFYGSPQESKLGIVGNIAKSLFKQEPKTTRIRTEDAPLIITESMGGYGIMNSNTGAMVDTGFATHEAVMKRYGKLQREMAGQQHSIDITPALKQEVEKGLPLFQKGKGRPKGAVETLADGRVIIHAMTRPDFSTLVHEITHVFEKDLTPQEVATIEKWSGKKQGTREFSEAFARGGERYLRDGKAPNEQLKAIFEKFKKWLTDIYKTLKGSPLEKKLSPEVRKIFDRLLTERETQVFTAPRKVFESKGLTDKSPFTDTAYKELLATLERITKAFGFPAKVAKEFMGLWAQGGDVSFEGSAMVTLPTADKKKADLFSALSGVLAKEIQNSVMNVTYRADAEGRMFAFKMRNGKLAESLVDDIRKLLAQPEYKDSDIGQGASFDTKENILYIGVGNEKDFAKFADIINKHKNGITERTYARADISFLGREQYRGILQEYRDTNKGRYEGKVRNDLDNLVEQALEKYDKEEVTAQSPKISPPTVKTSVSEEETPVKEGGVPPKPPIVEKEAEKPIGETKFRRTQINALIQDQTLQQQEVAKIVDAHKERYKVLHQEEAVTLAKELIDSLGVQGASMELANRTRRMDELPIRQVARQILLDFYSRAIIDTNATEADKKTAFEHIDRLQEIKAREATKAGQASSLLQIWKFMQPLGLLEYTIRKIQQANESILKRKRGDSTVGEQIDDLYGTLSEESKKIIADILSGKQISFPQEGVKTKPPSARKYVPKERIKQEQDYRKSLIEQYKRTQGGVMSASVTGLTSAQIELGGNLLASYVREGYYRVEDILQKLSQDFKSIGVTLDDKQKEEILTTPRTPKESYRDYLTRKESQSKEREAEKLISKKISDVITAHWSEKDELRRTLAQKLIDEVGLSEADAKRIEKQILEKFDKEILDRSQKKLTKLLGVQKIPAEKQKKGIVGKMIELVNLGALDEDLYRDLFAEKFKLGKITDAHKAEILKLANNVQMASGKGWLERDATIRLAKYIYELYPQKKSSEIAETWTAMAYSNMLFGLSTTALNLASAWSNITFKPVRDVTNISKWLRMFRGGSKGIPDIYNPIGEMFYVPALRGINMGAKEAGEVYINGDLNNKYVEDIAKKSQFKVTPLERDKYGKAKRFKPVTVKIGNTTIDLNIFNLYKYSGRNLAAQDKLMLNTSYEIELAHILRDKLKNPSLTGRMLTREVMRILKGENLDMESIEATLESDVALYKKMTGEDMSPLQKAIRKRELIREQLPLTPEEKEEAEMMARSNIFTDDRAGLFGTIAMGLGYLANSSPTAGVIIKPFVPFTKVVGNVAEYMMDFVPYYGLLRGNGWSVSAIKKLINSELPTAQMGERGSRAYYEQMGRAWFGTIAFSVALMMLLGNDEEDEIEISGGYNKEGFKKRGRENVLPPYTLRIGRVKIPYKNIPSLAIPLSLIGNINDALKDKRDEGDLYDRLSVALLLDAVSNSVFMVKDMSFLDGVQRASQIMADAASAEEGKWAQIGEGLVKSYLGFATRPLPQNNNAIQQIWKIFDPTSYSQSEIKGMLGYALGVQHFIGKPTIDQLGDTITSYPGETLMPYTHWLNIKGKDERWQFLAKYNAIPNKIYNRTMQIEGADGMEKRKLEEDELYDYTLRTGRIFSASLVKYMSDKEKVEKRAKDIIDREKTNGEVEKISGIREDVEKLWQEAKDQAEMELFRWGSVKETMPATWELIKKYEAYRPYDTAKETEGYKWSKSELYMFNNLATVRYAERVKNILTGKNVDELRKRDSDRDGKDNLQERLDREWSAAKSYAESQMRKQIREKIKNMGTK